MRVHWLVLLPAMAGLPVPIPAQAVTLLALEPTGPDDTDVLTVETAPFSADFLGSAGFPSMSGLDAQPGTGQLFASSGGADGGRLFTLDPETGVAALVGATGFDRVPGLAFDPLGALYGCAGGDFARTLVSVDPETGAASPIGEFSEDGLTVIEGLAFDPVGGVLYGAGVLCGDTVLCSTFTPQLFTVDETTGAATPLGNPVQSGTGTPLAANEDSPAGLAFDSEGNLFLSLGFRDGRILGIDLAPSPPEYVELGQATEGGSVSDIVALPEPGLGSLRLAGLAALLGIARRRRTGARRSSP